MGMIGEITGDIEIPEKLISVPDYNVLRNRPSIEGVELYGDKSFAEFGLTDISNSQLEDILD